MPKPGRTTPCVGCPWRVTSLRGYLGGDNPANFYWHSVTAEGMAPCHEQVDYSDPDWKETQLPDVDLCAGNLIHFVNTLKLPRRPELAVAVGLVKASKAVFSWAHEFLAYHMPGASEEEVRAACSRAILPGVNPDG